MLDLWLVPVSMLDLVGTPQEPEPPSGAHQLYHLLLQDAPLPRVDEGVWLPLGPSTVEAAFHSPEERASLALLRLNVVDELAFHQARAVLEACGWQWPQGPTRIRHNPALPTELQAVQRA
ncbi:hypothetical protein DAERI_020394 [Deinococcus aerius]|uniref:Uncharacterized protein n=2 Tax=Deinococcus aerius TaxID=200253 RepID=A0A2I9DR65_9DEIO|nr:hypothetical protein DAERI_020394 [Deinococcus aerius]